MDHRGDHGTQGTQGLSMFGLEKYFKTYKISGIRLVLSSVIVLCMLLGRFTNNIIFPILGWGLLGYIMSLDRDADKIEDWNKINRRRSIVMLFPVVLLILYTFLQRVGCYILSKLFIVINEQQLVDFSQVINFVFLGLLFLYEFMSRHPKRNNTSVLIVFVLAWLVFIIDQSRKRDAPAKSNFFK